MVCDITVVSCPVCAPSQLILHPQPGPVGEAEKALVRCKHCSAIAKTSLCYQQFSSQVENIAPHKLL